jgi:hypothetical protein
MSRRVILIILVITFAISIFWYANTKEGFKYRDISCHELCDMQMPGLLGWCQKDGDAINLGQPACSTLHKCIKECEDQQTKELAESDEGTNKYKNLL